ncbi:MAG: D-glucuronyl C5-epimerase family protein, partial [Candidatus Omnitrophica bacterium]|nr:D-glucuronyl C5-epimerase family protein [Candidatus Omnitrophota bacterium]
MSHLTYLRRIVSPYILRKNSQLTFWHERPKVNCNSFGKDLGEYYMTFFDKAGYSGPFDQNGIPLLDYHGKIGKQYNPIAIAQYGLGNYNLHKRNRGNISYEKFIKSANWLLENLETNEYGIKVWNHKFNWEYFQILQAPWYSALAQGQGISLLIRAYIELKEDKYKEAADKAFKSLVTKIEDGGVLFIDEGKN